MPAQQADSTDSHHLPGPGGHEFETAGRKWKQGGQPALYVNALIPLQCVANSKKARHVSCPLLYFPDNLRNQMDETSPGFGGLCESLLR